MPRMAGLGLLLILTAGRAALAQPASPPGEAATQPALTTPDIPASEAAPRPLPRKAGVQRSATSEPRAPGNPWIRTTGALAGVVALILLLGWGYRRVAAEGGWRGLAARPRPTPLIEVVGRAVLAPRQSVCLVRVGPRLVLVGCTPATMRALDVITDAELTARLLGIARQARPDSRTAEFERCLEHEAAAYGAEPEAPADAAVTASIPAGPGSERQVAAVRARLGATLERLRAGPARSVGA